MLPDRGVARGSDNRGQAEAHNFQQQGQGYYSTLQAICKAPGHVGPSWLSSKLPLVTGCMIQFSAKLLLTAS